MLIAPGFQMTTKGETLGIRKRRAKRCAKRQHDERRRQLRYEVAIFSTIEGIGLYDLFSPAEAFAIQHANLSAARAVFRKARCRVESASVPAAAPTIAATQFALSSNRPTTTLSRQNRSWIIPELSLAPLADSWSGLFQQGMPEATPSPVTRLSPKRYITLARDLAPRRNRGDCFDEPNRSDASASFWRHYRQGRMSYGSSFASNALKESCVALFSDGELRQLLPGVIMPRFHRRASYLTNLLWDLGRLCLDLFCARTLRPLCRHYFASGKPLPGSLSLTPVTP
jgi:hypothetical protein